MTRFEMEISGKLGQRWVESARKEVERMVEKASKNATVEEDGAIRWNSNGNYLPDDCCEMLEYAGFEFSREATEVKREAQNKEFLKRYKARQRRESYEEIEEMRAAFGEGATVVDVISGRRIQL